MLTTLGLEDPLFRQHQEDVAKAYEAAKRGALPPPLVLYQYKARPEDTLFTLAARLNLPYESISTLNSLPTIGVPITNRNLLIPNQPGIFLPNTPKNEIERLMHSWRTPEGPTIEIEGRVFYFLSQQRFHPVERSFFLQILFVFPLKQGIVTSSFGLRLSPITGERHFHSGIDLAAPPGTPVLSAREGKVVESGSDPLLGLFIVIEHEGNYHTLYGHLESKTVQLNQWVESGKIIGYVGMTGATTGPHLHFEVRQKGRAVDPATLLPRRIETRP
ncbi:MAG: M23 family metallopeptidase [Spirochaetales bacterium]